MGYSCVPVKGKGSPQSEKPTFYGCPSLYLIPFCTEFDWIIRSTVMVLLWTDSGQEMNNQASHSKPLNRSTTGGRLGSRKTTGTRRSAGKGWFGSPRTFRRGERRKQFLGLPLPAVRTCDGFGSLVTFLDLFKNFSTLPALILVDRHVLLLRQN